MKPWQAIAAGYFVIGTAVAAIAWSQHGFAPAVVAIWPWTLYQWSKTK